jgi:ketosteroid isomerase-like protein
MSKEAIDKAHSAWLDAMRANDPKALGPLMASDVVLMPPYAQPTAGLRRACLEDEAQHLEQHPSTAGNDVIRRRA